MFFGKNRGPGSAFDVSNIKTDFIAGFVIFLVALPLSIGISVASGAPPTAGIVSAIVGGILGSLISGSYVTISGPAAGLIVVMLDAVTTLGTGDPVRGFKITLAAVVFAGALQLLMALARLGTLGLAVPINALHGMMTSIGVTIIVKQFYVLGGMAPKSKNVLMQLAEIPGRLTDENLEILFVGLACLVVVIIFNKFARLRTIVPPPLAAIIIGFILSYVIDLEHAHSVILFDHQYEVGPKFLLSIPTEILGYFNFPDFSGISTPGFVQAVITIGLVASIESLLSTYAVDKLDPLKRVSNLNLDLMSKGVCNTLLGFIGGLPIISEIVRSSANVAGGARTRWANLFHGLLILLFIVLFPSVLNKIPLTAFAAILIFVGYRLANPKQLVEIYHLGQKQIVVFLFTLIVTLSTDLLIGILMGSILELVLNALSSQSFVSLFKLRLNEKSSGQGTRIEVLGPCVFSNMLTLKNKIEKHTSDEIHIDFSKSPWVDYSSRSVLSALQEQWRTQNKRVHYTGLSGPLH